MGQEPSDVGLIIDRQGNTAVQRYLTPLVLLAIVVGLLGGISPQNIGPTTVYAEPEKPPVPTPVVTPSPPASEWTRSQMIAAAPQANSCASSPFGAQLIVGGENELFVSYNDAYNYDPTNGYRTGVLSQQRFDRAGYSAFVLQQSLNGSTTETDKFRLNNSYGGSSVVADLNGDGRTEFVQVTRDGVEHLRIVTTTNNGSQGIMASWRGTLPEFRKASLISATAGNLRRRQDAIAQQVAVAYLTEAGKVHVDLWSGSASGGIAQADNTLLSRWQGVTDSDGVVNLGLAAADVTGDGFDELALVVTSQTGDVELFVLSNQTNVNTWTTLANSDLSSVQSPSTLIVRAGDVDGDYKDEIVLAYTTPYESNPGFEREPRVVSIKYHPTALVPTQKLATYNSWQYSSGGDTVYRGLSFALADTDQDGLVEPTLAFWSSGQSKLMVITLDAEQPIVLEHNRWTYLIADGGSIEKVAVNAGDLDKDGYSDIVLVYLDSTKKLQLMHLRDRARPATGIILRRTWSEANSSRSTLYSLAVHLNDWNNDSLKAVSRIGDGTTLGCREVEEPQVSSAVFVPPTWQNIQTSDNDTTGSIGKTTSTSVTTDTAYIAEHSQSATVSVGVEIDATVAEVSVKATAGREWSESKTNSNSTTESQAITIGADNTKDFVVVNNTNYNCYTYQGNIGATKVSEQLMRLCALNGVAQETGSLDHWDNALSSQLQWTPIVRDWSSLTQFRKGFTAQSTTAGSNVAGNAADGNTTLFARANSRTTKNPISETGVQNAGSTAWWQVDLGSVQDITKIRLWNGDDQGCTPKPCGQRLKKFYVFVSKTDFRAIPNSNNINTLIGNTAVQKYPFENTAGEVVSFLTKVENSPIKGRYVRVQLVDSGALALAEVQVLGPNHVEPNRYPTEVRPGPVGSGYFITKLYNPVTKQYEEVRNRGKLIWNGVGDDVLKNSRVAGGGGTISWSLTKDRTKTETEATSIGNNFSVGAEIDVAVGLVARATFGASYQYTSGVTRENSTTFGYGEGFELGGSVENFPETVGTRDAYWPAQCRYGLVPYYYEMTELTNLGVQQRILMVDYTVPAAGVTGLDRTRNLGPCERGEYSTVDAVKLSRSSISFGNQQTGVASAAQTIKVTNHTSTPLRINSIQLGGAVPSAYQQSNTCQPNSTTKLDTFASCTINVQFKPTRTGAANATLTITTDSTAYPTLNVALSGTGVAPAVTLSNTMLNFAHQHLNSTSAVQQVTLKNTGTAPLRISAISRTGSFLHRSTCPTSTAIAAGATCTISVSFRPTIKGSQAGAITITDNASGSPRTINLRGIGASVGLSPSSLAFGTQLLNTTSAARQVTITNNGTVALPLYSFGVSGAQASAFIRTHTCPASLAVDASCKVSISFKPTTSGAQSARLNVVYNPKSAPRTVALSGTGTALSVTPSALAFGNLKVGTTSASKVVTVINRGTTTIALGAQTLGGANPTNFVRTTTCGSSLAPSARCTVSLKFTPKATGAKAATLQLASNAGGNPHVVTLSGNGTP